MAKQITFKQFSEDYLNLKEVERNDISRVINKLLQKNFLTKRKQNDANDYRFILAYKDIISQLLLLIDFELIIKREYEVCYIKNLQSYNRLSLKKTESILLLVLRILYQRKMALVTLDEDVEIELKELHDELSKIGFLDNKRITKIQLIPILQMLKGYNIIDYLADKKLQDDTRVKIYPTILFVVNFENIKNAVEMLDNYLKSSKDEEEK